MPSETCLIMIRLTRPKPSNWNDSQAGGDLPDYLWTLPNALRWMRFAFNDHQHLAVSLATVNPGRMKVDGLSVWADLDRIDALVDQGIADGVHLHRLPGFSGYDIQRRQAERLGKRFPHFDTIKARYGLITDPLGSY